MDVVSISVAKNQLKDVIDQGSTTTGDLICQDPDDETGGLIQAGTIAGLDNTLKLNTHAAPAKTVGDKFDALQSDIASKQNTLTAGNNITISGNTISASGGMTDAERQRLNLLEEAVKGKLYTEQTITTNGNQTVPNALSKAVLTEIGGKTVVWNTVIQFDSYNSMQYPVEGATVRQGHKYYICCDYTKSEESTDSPQIYVYTKVDGENKIIMKLITSSMGRSTIATNEYTVTYNGSREPSTVNLWVYSNLLNGTVSNYHLIDLTQMFGSGNEPTDVTDSRIKAIEAYAESHPEYNAGELVSADVLSVVSNGRNIIIQRSDYNVNNILLGLGAVSAGVYTISWYGTGALMYVRSGSVTKGTQGTIVIGSTSVGGGQTSKTASNNSHTFTIPYDGEYYIQLYRSTTNVDWSSDIAFMQDEQVSRGESAISYAPYRDPISYTIPEEVRELYPLRSAGSIKDSYEFDGEKWRHVKRVGSVDLGTLEYNYSGDPHYRFNTTIPEAPILAKEIDVAVNVSCAEYNPVSIRVFDTNKPDMAVRGHQTLCGYIFIRDSRYTDKTNFKSAMNGVMLYHELATPVVTDITGMMGWDGLMSVEAGGSIEFTQDSAEWNVPNKVTYLVRTTGGN